MIIIIIIIIAYSHLNYFTSLTTLISRIIMMATPLKHDQLTTFCIKSRGVGDGMISQTIFFSSVHARVCSTTSPIHLSNASENDVYAWVLY